MTLRFIDGFDHYSTAYIAKKYDNYSGVSISSDGRYGNCLSHANSASYVRKNFDNQQTLICGAAFKYTQLGAASATFCFYGSTNFQVVFRLNSTGNIEAYRGPSSVLLGTSSAIVPANKWVYLEFKVKVDNTAGTIDVRMNNTNILSLSDIDTQYTAVAYMNRVYLYGYTTGCKYDDVYICDGAGTRNNDFLGDCKVECLFPDANGSINEWTPSAGNNYACVDEQSEPDLTDYVSTTIEGLADLYSVSALEETVGFIYGLQPLVYARTNDAINVHDIAIEIKTYDAYFISADHELDTTSVYYGETQETNPSTGELWTIDEINSAEFGFSATINPTIQVTSQFVVEVLVSLGTIFIAGFNRTADVLLENTQIEFNLTNREDNCTFTVKNGDKPTEGQSVVFIVDDLVFGGIVDEMSDIPQTHDITWYDCKARDYTYQLDRRLVVEDYENYTADEIVRDIITKYCAGFTSTHVYTGAPLVEKKQFPYMKPSDCFKWLVNYVGWDWYVDSNKDVWFFNPNALEFPAPISIDATTETVRNISYTVDIEGLTNRVYVIGGTYLSDLLSPALEWKSDGLMTSWILPWEADYDSASLEVGGLPVTLGESGVDDETAFEYMLDSAKKTISCGTASTPADGTQMSLSCKIPLDVTTWDENKESQIAVAAIQGGDGIYESVIFDDSLTTLEAAIAVAQAEINDRADPIASGNFETFVTGWKPGQIVSINIPARGINNSYVVQKVTVTPYNVGSWKYKVYFGGRLVGLPDYLRAIVSAQQQSKDVLTAVLHKVYKEIEDMTVTDTFVSAVTSPPYVYNDIGSLYDFVELA